MSFLTEFWVQLFGAPTDWLMFFGTITGALAVLFLALNKGRIGWTFGIVNAILFLFLMFQYKLYADVTLNGYYLITSAAGLFWWLRGGRKNNKKVPLKVSNLNYGQWLKVAAVWIVGTLVMGFLLDNYTDASVAYVDSFTTVGSLVAQFLLARKIFDNWYIWIFVDIIDIGLYMFKGMPAVALMTVIYMVFCVIGLKKFAELRRQETGEIEVNRNVQLSAEAA